MTTGTGANGLIDPNEDPYDDPETATDLFRAVGKQIKVLRERAGLTQRELGDRLGYSGALINSLEGGRRIPQPEFLRSADEFLNAGGVLEVVKDDVLQAKARNRVRHPAWFRDYARLEAEAVEVHFWSTLTVPGLLQTEDYARTTFEVNQPLLNEETIEQRVAARLARQEILTNWPPPIVSAVLDESVLRRRIGGREIQRGQLVHLQRLAQLRSTTLQVMPLDCEGHAGLAGPFILLTTKKRQQVAYMELQDSSRLVSDPEEVRILAARYGHIRGQALTPRDSLTLIEKLLGEL